MNDARVTEKGFSSKSFFAALAVLPCRIARGRHVTLVDGDSFTAGACGRREIVRVRRVSAVGGARGNNLLNMLNYVPLI